MVWPVEALVRSVIGSTTRDFLPAPLFPSQRSLMEGSWNAVADNRIGLRIRFEVEKGDEV